MRTDDLKPMKEDKIEEVTEPKQVQPSSEEILAAVKMHQTRALELLSLLV